MISVVCWLWDDTSNPPPRPPEPPRSQRVAHRRWRSQMLTVPQKRRYLPEHVNVLRNMLERHLKLPHKLVCIADDSKGLDPRVEFLKTPAAAHYVASLRSPEGPRFPSCYRRLWVFSPEAKVLGERILTTDIDVVTVGPLDPIFEMKDDFVGWRPARDWGGMRRFGGGNFLLTPGTCPSVWSDFNGQDAIARARLAGYRGSDQAWISFKLASKAPCWPQNVGIYSVRDLGPTLPLLPGSRLIHFNGHVKPWTPGANPQWVRDNWR